MLSFTPASGANGKAAARLAAVGPPVTTCYHNVLNGVITCQKATVMQNYNSKFQDPQVREWSYDVFSNNTVLPEGHTLKMNVSCLTKILQQNTFCYERQFFEIFSFLLKKIIEIGLAVLVGEGGVCVCGRGGLGTALSLQICCESEAALKNKVD